MSKAFVLLSGGVDSSTCLYDARDTYESVTALSVLYGQRHAKEVECAKQIAHVAGIEHVVVDITGVMGIGGLTDPNLDIPKVTYAELGQGVSPTYVPFRNGLLLSILTSRAAADPECIAVYYGAHADDAAGDAYPDCTLQFAQAMANAINTGTYGRITLQAPLIGMEKSSVVTLGESLGVPWQYTWSCYEGGELHCGVCPTCRARHEAFEKAGVMDLTLYMEK